MKAALEVVRAAKAVCILLQATSLAEGTRNNATSPPHSAKREIVVLAIAGLCPYIESPLVGVI